MSSYDEIRTETGAEEEEFDPTTPEGKDALRRYEDDILGGLLAAASFESSEEETYPLEVARNGVVYFTFRVHPLREEQYHKCKERYTKYVRNKQLGIRVPEKTDAIAYRNALIYEATVKEDRERLWDNHEAWRRLDVINGVELIGRVLKAGEKDAILEYIDKISGYSMMAEETTKN